ncbi:hypothetical protein VII00023_17584 [Vibrio ichthyoenteri ATCC 700023]|uniref:Sel1 repeat family protein n=1 Tax=Vibrio ichthyoenteri ATCC 700023 TaxID=870968 RepID=F9RY98_9VIBR|nr:sel1 repeat family protein [Vibrio ichthyoenteri]EGU46904.1 hypothetical protein VII00023_17584 [Vibrio ichthyoenteri ATCC 700023]
MKWLNCYTFILVVFVFGFSSLLHANQPIDELTPEQAYQQGSLLYQQNKYNQAKPLLKFAADHNHSPAAAMYASMFFSNTFIQSEGEHEYTLKSAELGNVFAMVAASSRRALADREYWRNKVIPILEQRAAQDDGLAMRLFYVLTIFQDKAEALSWLEQAAEAGDAFSQHELAKRYENGHDWFLIPGKREKEIERLLKTAADSGYRPAMLDYAYRLENRGDIEGYQYIIDNLVAIGDAEAIRGLGAHYRMAKKAELSAYYYKIFLDTMGNEGQNNGYETVQFFYDVVIKELTPLQVNQVKKKVNKYLKNHTVHFQKRIKDYEYTVDSFK